LIASKVLMALPAISARCSAPNGERIGRLLIAPNLWLPRDDASRSGLARVGRETPPELFGGPIRVVLTIAHLDHVPENNDEGNLLALCQRCHLLLDLDQHRETARRTRAGRAGRAGRVRLPFPSSK
jgi:hypothetical protein